MLRATEAAQAPAALAMRAIALAQLEEHAAATELLQRAAGLFRSGGDRAGEARCHAAAAEIALDRRSFAEAERSLASAAELLRAAGDDRNAAWTELCAARLAALRGDVASAEEALGGIVSLDETIVAARFLASAEIALRRHDGPSARYALDRAAALAPHPHLVTEIARLGEILERPVGLLQRGDLERPLRLEQLASTDVPVLVDGLRRLARTPAETIDLSRRPVLLALLLALAARAPDPVPGNELIRAAFGTARPNESHRARLRVELGRLRRVVPLPLRAVNGGWRLDADAAAVVPLAPEARDPILALLSDGASWPAGSLADALGRSQRSVQRDLASLGVAGHVHAEGAGNRRTWRRADPLAPRMLLLLPPPDALSSGTARRNET